MIAYQIDPQNRQINLIHVPSVVEWKLIKQYVPCRFLDVVRFKAFDLWIDDEGLMEEEQSYFHITHEKGAIFGSQMIAGKSLVLSSNKNGDSIPPKIKLHKLEKRIFWELESDGKRQANKILNTPVEITSFDTFDELMRELEKVNKNRL
jgi:hypothetical protein